MSPPPPAYGVFTYIQLGSELYFPWDSAISDLAEEDVIAFFDKSPIMRASFPCPIIQGRSAIASKLFGDMPLPGWFTGV
jgi:hypothetical protein